MAGDRRIARSDSWILGLLTVFVAVHLGMRAATQAVSFDESWHIFYAWIDDGWKFVKEVGRDMHPPTCAVLWKILAWFGTEPFWPRLLSVASAAAHPILWFLLLRRFGIGRWVAHASTIALCTSHVFLDFGCIVRGYAFANALVIAAFLATAELLPGGRTSRRTGVLACTTVALAFWSEYSAAFSIAAWFGAIALTGVVDRSFGRGVIANVRQFTRWPERVFVVLAVVGIAAFYFASYGLQELPHGNEWFPAPGQPASDFVATGLVLNVHYFTPLDLSSFGTNGAVPIIAALGIAFGIALRAARRAPADRERVHAVVLFALIGLVVLMATLGVLRKYPWGGFVRQQFVLVPLLHATLAIALHHLAGSSRTRQRLVAAIVLAGAGLNAWYSHRTFDTNEVQYAPLWLAQREIVFAPGETTAVCTPNCGLFGIGGQDGDGLAVRFEREVGAWDVFSAGQPRRPLLRPRKRWVIGPLPELAFLQDLRRQTTALGHTSIWVFAPRFHSGSIEGREAQLPVLRARCMEAGFDVAAFRVWPEGETYRLTIR